MTNELPPGWIKSSLHEITISAGGGTPSKSDASYWTNGTIPWVSPKDMKTFVVRSSEDLVTPAALDRLSLVPSDSVLVVVRSGILSRTLPVALTAVDVTINQDMRAFIPGSEISAKYLAWQLIAKEQELLDACAKDGTTVASLEGPALANFPLFLAPTSEQIRVVEKLEELLTDLVVGIGELKTAQRKLVKYRQSLLKAAVDGSLTASWRQSQKQRPGVPKETGAQLLERILAERRARLESMRIGQSRKEGKELPGNWRDRYSIAASGESTELPELPDGWAWTSLGECFYVGVGATPSRKQPEFWNDDVPWVSSGEVRFNRIVATKEGISSLGLASSSTRINPVGSVLLGMIGEGKTRGQVALLGLPAANNQNCAAIWVSETDVPPEYVYFWLWSRYDETRRGSSGNNQPALNKSVVERIPLPLPPLDEMKAIVEMMSGAFEQIEQQESAVTRALKQALAQRQNILRAAFSGQLVPQDPNDEPASVLLERIRADRAARKTVGAKRGRKSKASA